MARRPTMADVARAAGVGIASLDPMLNGRARVSEATARKVAKAAAAIGYHGAPALRERALADVPQYRLGVVLQKERHAFYQDLARHLDEAARRDPAHRAPLSRPRPARDGLSQLYPRMRRRVRAA